MEQLVAGYEARPLLFWVFGSVLLYALVTNCAWVLTRVVKQRSQWVSLCGSFVSEASALLFFVGVPYLALGGWPLPPFSGLLSPADMGMAGLGGDWPLARWLETTGTGLALGSAAVVTLAAAWALANRGQSMLGLAARSWWQVPIRGFYREVHWGFYRAALSATLGDLYAGIWAGMSLVLLEWSLNPAWRAMWRDPRRAGHAWLGAGLALLSTLLFLLTRNLWVCIAVHWLVSGTLVAVAGTTVADETI